MKKILAALTILGVCVVFLMPSFLHAEPGQDVIYTFGHYIYPPGGKKKLLCDGTGTKKCIIKTYKQYTALPEEIEGYSGQDTENYYFDAVMNENDETVNAIGGDETIAIPKALWPEE